MWRTTLTFLVLLVADYLGTVGTRLVVAQSIEVLPLVAINTAFWCYSVRKTTGTPAIIFVIAGVLGTWAGITFP